jgi:hypothetical protein
MKILQLPRYGPLGASSRMRTYQYFSWLRAAGIEVESTALFPDSYVASLQAARRNPVEVVRAYAARVANLVRTDGYDLLWIEKEALPWVPEPFERLLLGSSIPYVLDYDDAVFHHYDENRRALVRFALGGKHPALMRGASLVVAGNHYLATFAERAGARAVELLPTVIDLERYPLRPDAKPISRQIPLVGWIGQRVTGRYLQPLAPLFGQLSGSGTVRFRAIGIDAEAFGLPMESAPWSEATEVAALSELDIGIMPLEDAPFERGKCGYKLIQYMACSLPVIASPVGANRDIVEHGVNGFLAHSIDEWRIALEVLAASPELRQRMGRAGRKKVERQYAIQATGPRLATLLLKVAAHPTISSRNSSN